MFVAHNALETGSQRHGWTHQSAHFPRNTHTHTHVRTVRARVTHTAYHHVRRPPNDPELNNGMLWWRTFGDVRILHNTRHRRTFDKYSLLLLVPLFHSLSRQSVYLIKLQPLHFNNGIYIHNKDFKFYLVFTLHIALGEYNYDPVDQWDSRRRSSQSSVYGKIPQNKACFKLVSLSHMKMLEVLIVLLVPLKTVNEAYTNHSFFI